eukprot:scaffold27288_cov49-Attheya_sp.AAC.2
MQCQTDYLALGNIVPQILEVPQAVAPRNDASRVGLGILKLKLNLAGAGALILLLFQCETCNERKKCPGPGQYYGSSISALSTNYYYCNSDFAS